MKDVDRYIEYEKKIMEMEYDLITEYIHLRKDAKLSQQDLADQSNIIRTTIARIENKMNSPHVKTLLQMLEPLGYTLKIEKIDKKN